MNQITQDTSEEITHPVMVLLVDDQSFVAELLRRELIHEKDINLHYCQDPFEAVRTAEKIGPTVILLDLIMPGLDGLTLCKFLRAHPGTCDIPIVILSSNDDPVTKATSFAAGANDYLVKLPDTLELIARLRYHSASYINKLQRDDAYRALRASQMMLQELNEELEARVQERTRQLLDAQEELLRKEKLSVLGQVAGSVGHELRNPLGVMSNAVYFLEAMLTDADQNTKEYLNIIKSEIDSSVRIVSDLLDSVRTRPPQPQEVDVAEMIGQALHKCSVPPAVTVTLNIPAAQPPVLVDPQQIRQVFHNLITNAVEAMPDGGTLEIHAAGNQQDATATIRICDSGSGIAQEHLNKLFQPLFTTKARGIGLGLVVVKNLVQANGGTIEVDSAAGKGTMFNVTLPSGNRAVEGKIL